MGEKGSRGKDGRLHEKGGEDYKTAERFTRRSVSHLPPLPLTLFSPNSPKHVTSTLYDPPSSSLWASKTPTFSIPSSSLFPMPGYQGKEETLGWFCHKRNTGLCPIYSSFSKAESFLLEDGGTKAKWNSLPSQEGYHSGLKFRDTRGKENSFFFLPYHSSGENTSFTAIYFPICEARIHSVISENGPDTTYKSYYCNFFLVFNHKEHCSALSLFIFSALIFITGENPYDWKPLLETTAGRNHNMTYEKTSIFAKPVGRDEVVFPCSGNILSSRR